MRITQALAIITLISLPLYTIRCKDFAWCSSPIPFTLLEIFIIATFLFWLLWRVSMVRKGGISAQKLFQRLRGPFFWPGVLFLVISTMAVFLSPDLRAASGVWKAYFVEPALLFIVVFDISLSKKSTQWIFNWLFVSGLWLSVLAVWQAITEGIAHAPDSAVSTRVTAVFDNPNAVGLYLAPLTVVGFGVLLQMLQKKEKTNLRNLQILVLVATVTLFLLAIYLSKSRGAILGVGVAVVFLIGAFYYPRFSNILKMIIRRSIYIGLAVIAAVLILGFINIDRLVPSQVPKPTNTLHTRLCIWQATNDMMSERLITGLGISGFPKVYPDFATCESHPFQYPHNIFLNFWAELGILGLAVFLWIAYVYTNTLSRYLDNLLAVSLLSVLVYIFVHGLVDVPYFKNDLSSQFWVFLAAASWFGSMKT
jgi:O-antigen ligase